MNAVLSLPEPASLSVRRALFSSPVADVGVDVSTATPLPRWDAAAPDNQHAPPHAPYFVSAHTSVALHDSVWSDHLSPQLQRNKQLHDTLMQKEEELARLQEENNKLKEFLNSSYVKSLEEKSKRLLSCHSVPEVSYRKRCLQQEEGDVVSLSRLLQGGEGKRACRNLSLEFCSAEELASTPPLDSWILETLGLGDDHDRTVHPDTSSSGSPTDTSFGSPATSADHFSPATRHHNTTSCFSPTGHHATTRFSPAGHDASELFNPTRHSATSDTHFSPREHNFASHFSPTEHTDTTELFSPTVEYSSFSDSSSSLGMGAEFSTLDPSPLYTSISSLPAVVPVGPFTPPRAASTPHRSHASGLGQHPHGHAHGHEHIPSSPPQGEGTGLCTPRRTDLAFSMSLSPQNSVKTHTFPQGQAFTRRDSQGGWNFTWVPKQCS